MMPELRWDDRGLLPAVVQDWRNGEVLMLAYVNEEALRLTLATGQAHYWSRSRGELWRKGATSGHTQAVKSVRYDCDADALLYVVEQTGPACHTGEQSCFFRQISMQQDGTADMTPDPQPAAKHIIDRLFAVIQDRRAHPREGSYTNRLFQQGSDEMAKKVGEEAVEVVLAAAAQGSERLTSEAADLIYHLLVLLAAHELEPSDLYRELERRMKP